RAVVGDRRIVVDRLRYVHRDQRIAKRRGDLRHLQAGVGGVVASVIEKIPDVVRAEHLDQPFVLRTALVQSLELVAGRAERTARRVREGGDRARGFAVRVDQVLGERTDDPVATGVDVADFGTVLARRLDDGCRGGVDDGGDAAGLRVEGVARAHRGIVAG